MTRTFATLQPWGSRFLLTALAVLAFAEHAPAIVGALGASAEDEAHISKIALSSAFTFQGRLDIDGVPANGAYDFEFALFDNATVGTGTPLGTGVLTANDVAVANGAFTRQLDFGTAVFNGDARWIEVRARAGASTGAYTTLGRQELTATPYALVALNFAAHDHLGEDWIGSDANAPGLSLRNLDANGTALYTEAGRIGLQALTSEPGSYAAWGQSDGANGTGVRGSGATGVLAEGVSRGLLAFASQAGGQAVRGEAGAGTGVYGLSLAKGHAGTTGINNGTSCNSGNFENFADNCVGVFGQAVSGGLAIGVFGNGRNFGIYGRSDDSGGEGVRGISTGNDGVGVVGINRHATCFGDVFFGGECAGVSGQTSSFDGVGVAGQGGRIGVWGEANQNVTNGIGIYGESQVSTQWAGYFNGNVFTSGTYSSSDARLKKDLAASAGLAEILALNPVSFAWIADDGLRHQGLIAQEVREVLPDLVVNASIDGSESLSVAYGELIPVLVQAIQDQQEQIDALRALITPAP